MAHQVRNRVMVVDWDEQRGREIVELMTAEEHLAYLLNDADRAMAQIYNEPPDLIVLAATGDRWQPLLTTLKNDGVFRYLPVLALLEREMFGSLAPRGNPLIDDLLVLPLDPAELCLRVNLALHKASRHLDANPLTRLPGNYTIIQTVQELIDAEAPFAIAHVDLDNFKPFNDCYGFSRGDEVLRMTGRVLANTVRNSRDPIGFVGHIGGDDFVMIVHPSNLEGICRQIILHFDMIIGSFFDDEDRIRGYIESVDRQGNKRQFSITTISLAAVVSTNHNYRHYGEYAAVCNEVKKAVKQMEGSNFLIDRRRTAATGDLFEQANRPQQE